MTVGELIDRLGGFPSDTLVVVDGYDNCCFSGLEDAGVEEETLYHSTHESFSYETHPGRDLDPERPDPFHAIHITQARS